MFILPWSLQIVVITLSDLEAVRRKFSHSSEKIRSMTCEKYLYYISNEQLYCQGATNLF